MQVLQKYLHTPVGEKKRVSKQFIVNNLAETRSLSMCGYI